MPKKKQKEKPLKIRGDFGDALNASAQPLKGKETPDKKDKKKKNQG